MDEAPALQDFFERLELQIFARRNGMFPSHCARVVVVPLRFVGLGLNKGGADGVLDSHASRGVPGGVLCRAAARGIACALWVLSQGELDTRSGAFKKHLLSALAPTQFHHHRLAAD